MERLPPALNQLAAYRQFIAYRLEAHPDKPGKTLKKPINIATGRVHDPHDAGAWVSFEQAAKFVQQAGGSFGVGFVFTANDPFWFLDIDNCLDEGPPTRWNAIATQLCGELSGCAVEVSSSGRGLHLFGTGAAPAHACKNVGLGLEFYTELRFVALTGLNTLGNAAFAPPGLGPVVGRYFPLASSGSERDIGWWSESPVPQWRGPLDDKPLIERALRSVSAAAVFGGKARFTDLWHADAAVLGACWPADNQQDAYDQSSADAALAQHLAFWTGNNAARIERLMRESALVRDKWADRDDYLPRTIRNACSMQREWLADPAPAASPFAAVTASAPVAQAPIRVTDRTLLQPDEQVTFFAGCCYVTDEHKIMVPDGSLLDTSRFNARFGGRTFVMDDANTRVTRKAFEAFTESQTYRFPRADSTCFRPLRAPGEIVHENGRTLVNTWVPIAVPRAEGDVARFWDHLARLVPNERDRMILAGYMATIVQHQGHKLQWAPLVQGTTGNGKGILSNIVKRAIGRPYCHSPKAKDIDNSFNAWLEGHTFYAVDEIYISDTRLDVLETLKPMITEDEGLEVTKKGIDSGMREVCGNFMFFSNYLAAMRKNRHDRRIAPVFTAQQEPEDLARDGLTEAYFADYVDWLKARGKYQGDAPGYAVLAQFLWTWPIPAEFDARKDVRAPQTSSTERAILEGRGRIEQEVAEAIDQQEIGFKGGWVSSTQLRRVIERAGAHLALNKQPEVMASLGYIQHPMLKDGRVNNAVPPDGGRPRLYVHRDNAVLLALATPAEIAAVYSTAQMAT